MAMVGTGHIGRRTCVVWLAVPVRWALLLMVAGACQRVVAQDAASPEAPVPAAAAAAALPQYATVRLKAAGPSSLGVYELVYSPDGKRLASRGADQIVRVWDTAAARQLAAIDGHKDRVQSVAFSPDGKVLATCSDGEDPAVRFWDPDSGKKLRETPQAGRLLRFLPEGRGLRVASHGRAITLSEAGIVQMLRAPHGEPVAFSSDGDLAAIVGSASAERIFLHSFTRSEPRHVLGALSSRPVASALSPDGALLAVGIAGNTGVNLWDVRQGPAISVLGNHSGPVQSVAFSSDSRYLASGSWDKSVRVWDVATRRTIAILQGHQAHVCALAFSPDGRYLASGAAGADDTSIVIWDARAALYPVGQDLEKLTQEERVKLLAKLSAEDPTEAHAVIGSLLASPKTGQALLAARLRGNVGDGRDGIIRRLISQLDDDDFRVREAAHKQLLELRSEAESLLRETLTSTPSAEVRHRVERILRKRPGAESKLSRAERLWLSRAILTLELLGTAEARQMLTEIASRSPKEEHVAEAAAALKRLGAAGRG